MVQSSVESGGHGKFRIRVGDSVGEYTDYQDVATLVLEVNGKIEVYIAVTEYGLGEGVLVPERVYRIQEVS